MIEGTGLGLALSKHLIEELGGSIGVESEEGRGSCFWFELPRIAGPLEELASPTSYPPAIVAAEWQASVLLIEDNLTNVRLIERVLTQRPGVELLATQKGGLGLELAHQHPIDLILLDLHLPDMSGEEVFRRLALDPVTQHIPVVILSADARPQQHEHLLSQGVTDYLTKPLDVHELLSVLDRLHSNDQA
jgi:CheY-like chemotaxis protein